MSVKHRRTHESIDTQTEFIALTDAMGLGPEQLADCRRPETHVREETTRMFAVARIDGVIDYGQGELEEADGCLVLYLSADGTHAAERQYWVEAGEFDEIDVAFDAEPDAVEPAGANAQRFEAALDAHDTDAAETKLVTDGGRAFVDDRTRTHAKNTEQTQLVADVADDQQTLDGDDAAQRSLFGGDGR